MKVELRYCEGCKKRTIQAEDIYVDGRWSPAKLIKVWYCPHCGEQWKPVTTTKDKLASEAVK